MTGQQTDETTIAEGTLCPSTCSFRTRGELAIVSTSYYLIFFSRVEITTFFRELKNESIIHERYFFFCRKSYKTYWSLKRNINILIEEYYLRSRRVVSDRKINNQKLVIGEERERELLPQYQTATANHS